MQEKAVSGFRKVIAEGNALIIGSDDDVHGIVLSLIIALSHYTLTIRAFLVVQHQLVVMIANTGILTIQRYPCGINTFLAVYAFQCQVAAPVFMDATRYGQSRLKQTVIYVNSQLAMRYNQLIFIRNTIGHAIDLDDVVAIGR